MFIARVACARLGRTYSSNNETSFHGPLAGLKELKALATNVKFQPWKFQELPFVTEFLIWANFRETIEKERLFFVCSKNFVKIMFYF